MSGENDGALKSTMGKKKGNGVGGGPALYVVEKDVDTNTIIVGDETEERLFRTECAVSDLNWIADVSFPLECTTMIRYRQKPQKSRVVEKGGILMVEFLDPQRAITPGQVCAFYNGERVL